MSIKGLSAAQQRAALRRLVVAFGEMNAIVDLAAHAGTPDLRARAESARDLLGELVADIARPGGDRSCAVPAPDLPDAEGDERRRRRAVLRTGRRRAWIGSAGKRCGTATFDTAARRLWLRAERRPH
ncbi:hypothetical protein AB0L57_02170 [Nocardia sp. NPDC052254]|uniref:hypothetical protein n=1 Tax=Nocardia sp. NPDC052254 TaxID=3155681 RepID=UPI003438E5C2